MSKKNILIKMIILTLIIVLVGVFYWLYSQGYFKILGSVIYQQKIETIASQFQFSQASDYDKVDFSDGVLKLKSGSIAITPEAKITPYYISQGRGANGINQDSVSEKREIWLSAKTQRVTLSNVQADDMITVGRYNNQQVIFPEKWCAGLAPEAKRNHKCMGQFDCLGTPDIPASETIQFTSDLTQYSKIPGSNTLEITAKDWCGGMVGYSANVTVYENQDPYNQTSYANQGYYVSKVIGQTNTQSFDKLIVKGENKPAGTDIYYQFAKTEVGNFSSQYRPTNGIIELSNIPEIKNSSIIKVKASLVSTDGKNTPTLDGLEVYYTTKEIIPDYNLTYAFSFQSKSRSQSKTVKTKIITPQKSLSEAFELNLDTNNKASHIFDSAKKGRYLLFTKAVKHLSRKIEREINADATLTYSQFLVGDFNEDDMVNSLDWSIVNQYWWKTTPDYDVTGDDTVNSLDWSVINGNWGKRGEGLEEGINF